MSGKRTDRQYEQEMQAQQRRHEEAIAAQAAHYARQNRARTL